ncbi:MAG: flagellar basal body rod modification protein FlgD [Gemmatales bacterium]|nr:MAG: flagellar basal body rod modification protein FlgD [Gemmatales bacterium]
MNVPGVNGVNAGAASGASSANRPSNTLGREQFLNLLLIQLQNQDPLNPVSQSDFTDQLTQLSTLESLNSLNSNIQSLIALQQLTQGANLIGKVVRYNVPNDGEQSGLVSAVNIVDNSVQLIVDGKPISLSQVVGVTAAP